MKTDTLCNRLAAAVRERPDETAYLHKVEGAFRPVTWRENFARVETIARALMALGVKKGDRVAILSQTRIEWVQLDLAIVCCGAATVGIYPSSLAEDCAFVVDHCDAEVVIVEDDEQLAKLLSLREKLTKVRHLVGLDLERAGAPGVLTWHEFLAKAEFTAPAEVEARRNAVVPDDLASIVYTSGTTGRPKGAMLTHRNLVFASDSAAEALQLPSGCIFLLFLPLAHVFARLTVHLCMVTGNVLAFAESMQRVADNMKEVRPHYMAAVPRMYEKIHDRIAGEARKAGGVKEAIFNWALGVGMRAAARERAGKSVPPLLAAQRALAHRLAFKKIHTALGGRVDFLISGAAPLDLRTAEFFHAVGILILEGIGMTENSSFTHVNQRRRYRFGTVGVAGPGIETRIAEDGEILIRGANVMKGYYKDPENTAQTIDKEGWLATGDVGEVDADGFLKITDRKKDLLVTSGGKNIAPQHVEQALTASPFVLQAVVFGDRRKHLAALIVPDLHEIRAALEREGRTVSGRLTSESPEVQERIESAVAAANKELASFETVKKFRVLPKEMTVETGELTPTLKIKRKVVTQKHQALIEEMYAE